MTTTTTPRILRAVIAAGVATLAFLASFATGLDLAGAGSRPKPRQPALTINGAGTWQIREFVGDAVVNGRADVQLSDERTARTTLVAATVDPDDNAFPLPGECESGVAAVNTYGTRAPEIGLIGGGELCALHLQAPESIVKYTFTGTYEVLDGPRRLRRTDGFFEVRLAEDGSASVFAIDT